MQMIFLANVFMMILYDFLPEYIKAYGSFLYKFTMISLLSDKLL